MNQESRSSNKDVLQMANKHKRCSASLVVRKIRIEITIKFHLTAVRTAIIQKSKITNTGKDMKTKGVLIHIGENVNQ